ncbi:MAG TPA: hypothetical protein VFN83_04880, partial [Gemmatimonadales bacterium]|nr:hypothetical protein [Gemmatimonadales bacterium]
MQRRSFLLSAVTGLLLPRLPKPPHARPRPSPAQLRYQRSERALFLHFGVNTFSDREWGEGTEDPGIFNPAALDANQWARTARDA